METNNVNCWLTEEYIGLYDCGNLEKPKYLDSSDALGVALCHYFQKNPSTGGTSYSGWGQFVNKNPGRVV